MQIHRNYSFFFIDIDESMKYTRHLFRHFFGIFSLMRINEHGLQERENSRLYTKRPQCAGSGGHFVTASLVDTSPAMLVLVWGFAFAALLLFIEIAVHRVLKYRMKNKFI